MSNFAEKSIYEYRGVEGLVAARVTKDDKTGYTTGEVFDIAGVAEISKATENSTEAHYYDNMPAIVISSTGSDTITCSVSAIPFDVLAEITGQTYNKDLGALIEGKREQRYFALGYKTKNTKGEEIYVWRYKGSFAIPDSTHSTENAGTDANGQSLVFTGISTTYKFENADGTKAELRSININKALCTADLSTFFDTVTTPDKLITKKCATPTARPSAVDIYATDHIWLSTETEGAKVYYTMDGSDPTSASLEFTTPIQLTESKTIKAIGILENYENSDIASFNFTIIS
jgi:phi13 family phage major tail protein